MLSHVLFKETAGFRDCPDLFIHISQKLTLFDSNLLTPGCELDPIILAMKTSKALS